MKRTELLAIISLVTLIGVLASCTLGEPVMPNPPPGRPVTQEIGTVIPVPDPIPHTLEGRGQCFTCHAIGAVGAPSVPADHERDVAQCTTCHAVWTRPGIAAIAPPAIPHELEGREDCLTCHKMGTAGAPQVPDNHKGLPSSICRSCHLAGEEVAGGSKEAVTLAPPIPHGMEGFTACTTCHEKGGPGVPRFPADHIGRTDEICPACHRAAAPTSLPTPTVAPTPTSVAAGEALYAVNCAACHGDHGQGGPVAKKAINTAEFLNAHSDDDLRAVIQNGKGGMPAFGGRLSADEINALVAFIRSWQP